MHPNPAPPARSRKRIPKWLVATLGVFVILFVLGAIFGKEPEMPTQPLTAQASIPETPTTDTSTTTTSTTTTSAPPPAGFAVDEVVDGATVELVGTDGSHRTVHIRGLTVATGNNCYARETLTWATGKLIGATVEISADTSTGVALTLGDGTDYATSALQGGYAKYAADAISTSLQAVETSARQANVGLWASPCHGVIDAPTPQASVPTQAPPPSKKKATTQAPPPHTSEEQDPGSGTSSVYYANCAAAKAAHAAPLHIGDPGYRPGLDRDGDGIACEK